MHNWETWSTCCSDHDNQVNMRFRMRGSNCQNMDPTILREEQTCHWRPYNENYDRQYSYNCEIFQIGRRMNSQVGTVNFENPNIVKLKSGDVANDEMFDENQDWFASSRGFNFRGPPPVASTDEYGPPVVPAAEED